MSKTTKTCLTRIALAKRPLNLSAVSAALIPDILTGVVSQSQRERLLQAIRRARRQLENNRRSWDETAFQAEAEAILNE
jgi:hypothetical protein